jgi:hypothetical protein
MSGYTATYNRRAAGKAWAIAGYTLNGGGLCSTCADRSFTAAALSGEDHGAGDSPAPIFSSDSVEYREGGDHRGGCGLSCDPCGAVIVAACDPCRDSIEGGECSCECGCECYAGGFSSCVDCLEGTHQNNSARAGESRPVADSVRG